MASIARCDGPYAASFLCRRIGPAGLIVPGDSTKPAPSDPWAKEGAAIAAAAPAPIVRRSVLREIGMTLSPISHTALLNDERHVHRAHLTAAGACDLQGVRAGYHVLLCVHK